MANKVVLVTGSSRGIGKEIIREFAKAGYNCVINYNKSKDEAYALQKEISQFNVDSLVVKCDVSNEVEVLSMIAEIMTKFGGIDVLINNAGIAIDTLFCDKTAENFRKTLDVNVIGTFLVSKYVGEIMKKQKHGKIINLSSTNGLNTYFPMCLDYDASKSAIISFTHNLAMQFAPYVNVNCIAPGFIATENELKNMNDEFIKSEEEKIFLKRAGTAKDVANLALFLASEKASFINNAVMRIDGGQYGSV